MSRVDEISESCKKMLDHLCQPGSGWNASDDACNVRNGWAYRLKRLAQDNPARIEELYTMEDNLFAKGDFGIWQVWLKDDGWIENWQRQLKYLLREPTSEDRIRFLMDERDETLADDEGL